MISLQNVKFSEDFFFFFFYANLNPINSKTALTKWWRCLEWKMEGNLTVLYRSKFQFSNMF